MFPLNATDVASAVSSSPRTLRTAASANGLTASKRVNELVLATLPFESSTSIKRADSAGACIPDSPKRRHSFSSGTSQHQISVHCVTPEPSQNRGRRFSLAAAGSVKRIFKTSHHGTFFGVFGWLGYPTVIAFLLSAVALLNQAIVQINPQYFANNLMNTTNYDDGEFWMVSEGSLLSICVSASVLVGFALCYLGLAALMVFFRHKVLPKPGVVRATSQSAMIDRANTVLGPKKRSLAIIRKFIKAKEAEAQAKEMAAAADTDLYMPKRTFAQFMALFVKLDGPYHVYYYALSDLPKLMFQTYTLVIYLRNGFAISVIIFYAVLVLFNWLISFYRFHRRRVDRRLITTRLFYLFDLFFAVFAPLIVLLYVKFSFKFNREEFRTKEDSMMPGVYDRIARLFADPIQLTTFRAGYTQLQMRTTNSILVKTGLVFLSVYKWKKIIFHLIRDHHEQQRKVTHHIVKQSKRSRRHLVFGIVIFLMFGAFIFLYTVIAVVSSRNNCSKHVKCAVVSYQWYWGWSECPCLVYIDRNMEPLATYDQWINPPDTTSELAAVAKVGELRVVQIINRALPRLPIELRECTWIEQLILIYTKTEELPEWANEFDHLVYLHIEGEFSPRSLKSLPDDVFTGMTSLRFLHLGIVPMLEQLPSFSGLHRLKAIAVAGARKLTAYPPFDDLDELVTLNIIENAHVHYLPSLAALTSLRSVNVNYRNEMCCNGFLTGTCDLTDSRCIKHTGEADVQCVDERLSEADKKILADTTGSVCELSLPFDLDYMSPTLESTDVVCGGVLFKQCALGNNTGICYNGRMQVIYCDTSGDFIKMRQLQIARKVGLPCSASVEAWLGCEP
ncbi:TPA: hypothetical protein N0F65_000499 [Lagenidium giganteum]|uniref:WLGC domain-containing protein n=1 Tax=Lagenidium giganteum TaxID=4803 RepID=A0AAV2Z0R4_9STRA|nr:TPA: hypothetical protein N0F65_000499 [Lagenidium giganteum]